MLDKDNTARAKIKSKLYRKQIKQLSQGQTPDGYTWISLWRIFHMGQ